MGKNRKPKTSVAKNNIDETAKRIKAAQLAIVIVSYNTRRLLRRCLLSLRKNPLSVGDFATIVVDNASEDGSPEMVKKFFPEVYLIENDDNYGFAKACNQGLKSIEAKYYLLLNSDAAVMGNALDVLVSFMDANPDVGAAGGMIFTEDGNIQPSTLQYPTYWNLLFARSSLLSKLPIFRWKMEELRKLPEDVSDVPALAGGFIIFRDEALEEVGLLDERFFIYLEDVDICRRLKKAGWRVVFNPNARILHAWGASSKKRRKKAFWWHHMSMFKYFQKHYPYLLPLNIFLFFGLVAHFGLWWTIHSLTGWRAYREEENKNEKTK